MNNQFGSYVIVNKEVFKNSSLLESSNYSKLPKENVRISIKSVKDYLNVSESLEAANFVIVDKGTTYLVKDNVAVKV